MVHDQDSNDCLLLKERLRDLVQINNHNAIIPFLIRIACKELENWYLGDMLAIEEVYPHFKAAKYQHKKKYKTNPDLLFGAQELKRIVKGFSKGLASKQIPKFMSLEVNKSKSFQHLLTGIERFLNE